MSTVLITGASGFIGRALAQSLAHDHDVVCLSRRDPELSQTTNVLGDFAAFEDLAQLDSRHIDVAVHLAAVTGGCSERDGVLVNCEGTRCLMRYLINHDCRKFVMASSIALVGLQDPAFRPLGLPIADNHPCLDRDGYGLSKHLMEQITHYYARQCEDIDVINLRLSSVSPDDATPKGLRDLGPWALASITVTLLSDVVSLFAAAVTADHNPGVRTMNATCSRAWTTVPTAAILEHWWGPDADLGHFHRSGHEFASVYDVSRITAELGFVASQTLAALQP